MELYESGLKSQLIVLYLVSLSLIYPLSYSIANPLHYDFIIIYSLIIVADFLGAILITIDLVKKNYRIQAGKVIAIKKNRVHILKSDGKIKKVTVRYGGTNQFFLDQAVELYSARLSRYLVAIHSAEEERSVINT